MAAQSQVPESQRQNSSPPTTSTPPHGVRGLAQTVGIHPAVASLTFVVDAMLFNQEGAAVFFMLFTAGVSLGGALLVSTTVATLVGFVAYRAQMKWYGDDSESAAIKAVMLAILIAIPTNITATVYGPLGVVGIFGRQQSVQKRGTKLWLWIVVALAIIAIMAIIVIIVIFWVLLGRRS